MTAHDDLLATAVAQTGLLPAYSDRLHAFIGGYLRYLTHVYAYVWLLANPFPLFSGRAGYPVDLRLEPPSEQSRAGIFFRLFLPTSGVDPRVRFSYGERSRRVPRLVYALFSGNMNRGMRDLSAWLLRYEIQTYAYVFLLTGRYPNLAGAPTA